MLNFNFVVGNPPYQKQSDGKATLMLPVYHIFMDKAYELSRNVTLITPAKYLFNAGLTPKKFNQERINDIHFRVLWYTENNHTVFGDCEIKGGVAVSNRNESITYGKIGTFFKHPELKTIVQKVMRCSCSPKGGKDATPENDSGCTDYSGDNGFKSLTEIITPYSQTLFNHVFFETFQEHPLRDLSIKTNAFERYPDAFPVDKPEDAGNYYHILGRVGGVKGYREWRWVKKEYISAPDAVNYFKVFFPRSYGSGVMEDPAPNMVIGEPDEIANQSFLYIGKFPDRRQAENCRKYLQTKFARAMLSILRVTQDAATCKFRYVPIVDFSIHSDIDWDGDVCSIDECLFYYFSLSASERNFIRTHFK